MRVVMTEHARQFVTPLTFKEISGNAVATSMWNSNQEFNVEHIALANWADVFVVAPATANIIAKMAHGLADDLLSTTLLAAQAPIIVCPAMNTGMYENAFDAGKYYLPERAWRNCDGPGDRLFGLWYFWCGTSA